MLCYIHETKIIRYTSATNQTAVSTVIKEVKVRHPTANEEDVKGTCKAVELCGYVLGGFFSLFFLLAACERYFKSLHEDELREKNGTRQRHRASQKRLRRKKEVCYYVHECQYMCNVHIHNYVHTHLCRNSGTE